MKPATQRDRRTGRVCRACRRRYFGLAGNIVRDFGLCPACRARHTPRVFEPGDGEPPDLDLLPDEKEIYQAVRAAAARARLRGPVEA